MQRNSNNSIIIILEWTGNTSSDWGPDISPLHSQPLCCGVALYCPGFSDTQRVPDPASTSYPSGTAASYMSDAPALSCSSPGTLVEIPENGLWFKYLISTLLSNLVHVWSNTTVSPMEAEVWRWKRRAGVRRGLPLGWSTVLCQYKVLA